MLDEKDIQRNQRALDHAIAQQELEGLKVPDATVADMRRAVRGEITSGEVISNIYRRFKHVEIFKP